MARIFILISMLIVSFSLQSKDKDYTIVVGNLLGQEYVPDVLPSGCFKEAVYCHGEFYNYKIQINHVLAGEAISGVIRAARMQHGERYFRGSHLAVFVISRINNENTEKLLNTEYFLEEYVPPVTQYCFYQSLEKYIPELKESVSSNCLEKKEIYSALKEDVFEQIITDIESSLFFEGILLEIDYGYIESGIYVSEYDDSVNEEDSHCFDYMDRDKFFNDPSCFKPDITFDVIRLKVKQGYSELVKEKLLIELGRTRVGLDNVEMEFQFLEETDHSILEWRFRVVPPA